jgi:hypothetical protein
MKGIIYTLIRGRFDPIILACYEADFGDFPAVKKEQRIE